MKLLSIIVVISRNNAIGKDNQLLCHLPEDLKRFKRITLGHKIIMGRNTYFSLPKRPLPGRINIVLTTKVNEPVNSDLMVYSLEDAISKCDDDKENFVIGGGSVYRQFLPLCQKLYITKVDALFEADTFFPEIDPSIWELIEIESKHRDEKHAFDYSFLTYQRK